MTHHAPPRAPVGGADAGRQLARLREALRLVERIAGRAVPAGPDRQLEEAARASDLYDRALPVVQRRFDALAAETAAWAAAGVEALLIAGSADPPRAAAGRLAADLERALSELTDLIRR